MPEEEENHLEERLETLLSGLAGVHASIDAERDARLAEAESRDDENKSRDRRTKRTQMFAVIAGVVGIIGILVGGIGVTRASKADEKAAAAQVVAQTNSAIRTAAQKVTCDQANVQAAQHNSLADAIDQILVLGTAPTDARTAEQQAAIDNFSMIAHNLVAKARDPGRDCTPEGIAAYYNK